MGFTETHKTHLMELIQKTHMDCPVLRTDNEGSDHAPKFRSHVYVGGKSFTCQQTFDSRRDSEHDVCRIALEFLTVEVSTEPQPQHHIPTSKPSNFYGFFLKKKICYIIYFNLS
jgi:hypothetical protein